MSRGYIKLYRKSIESGWLKNPKLWTFWTYCLLKATHTEYTDIIGYQQVHLTAGQFVFGRKKAAEETGLTEQEVRTCIARLIKWQNLTIKTTNKYSIITIVNWASYQGEDGKLTSKSTSTQPTTNHIQEHKNDKNKIYGEKLPDKETLSAYLLSLPEYQSLSNQLKELIFTFINKIRQSNKTKALAQSRVLNVLSSLNEIMGKYGEGNLKAGLEAVFYKEQREGFLYSSHNVTGYIRAVAKAAYTKDIQSTNEERTARQREQLKQTEGGQLYHEIQQALIK